MDLIKHYFPNIDSLQLNQINQLPHLYKIWNEKINVISRKDIDNMLVHHILHSLSIAKIISFTPQTSIMDVGTGGGFPGIPLAIFFPECNFTLVDSIGKKIKVVNEIATSLNLQNVNTIHARAEDVNLKFDFVVSRAVTRLSDFYKWVQNKFKSDHQNALPNGLLSLKGGDLSEELLPFKKQVVVYDLNKYFSESFFETKKIVYLPA